MGWLLYKLWEHCLLVPDLISSPHATSGREDPTLLRPTISISYSWVSSMQCNKNGKKGGGSDLTLNTCMHIPSPILANRKFKMLQWQQQWEYPQSNTFDKQNNNFARAEHYFCIFLCRHCMTTRRNCLVSHFLEDVHKWQWNFLFLFQLRNGSQEFNPRRVCLHLTKKKQVGIIATDRLKGCRFTFEVMFLPPLPLRYIS